jgi:hypothetical protein
MSEEVFLACPPPKIKHEVVLTKLPKKQQILILKVKK